MTTDESKCSQQKMNESVVIRVLWGIRVDSGDCAHKCGHDLTTTLSLCPRGRLDAASIAVVRRDIEESS
jgi:hypothetical protein